jgi:branched-chain amino acid transport system permease protein
MDQFLQALINGIMLGGFYAIMVLGFSIIWGVMGVINLAHGEFVMVGAYLTWLLNTQLGWEPFLTLIVVLPAMFVAGYILQRLLINRIIERPYLISLLVTFGLSIMIANTFKLLYTATPRIVETALSGFWRVGRITVPVTKTYVMLAALVMMALLYVFLQYTRLGKAIRAAAQNKEAARIVGIEIGRVYALTFAIAVALSGAAGTLISPTQAIFPFMGPPLTLKAFAITAMSGLGNIPGALMGGIVLGLIEVLIATYIPGRGTNLGTVASFVILVLVLVTRPQGLFGGLKPVTEMQ